ncbi:B- and T-lymphocyte attenuator isoform X2 [Salarias fasciatus]|uniref:B- and T-lymphocyte attenuator isoform X2 n=1 Tax=Salarias fasciatus TaxID=181472 RepID=UPI0011768673|nr:B- and T-lymphocyte attenuator-like isoform X2 [Salarias fasciatus]
MRPELCWMHVSILSVLLLYTSAEGEESECQPEVRVHRNTVYRAVIGDELRINCTSYFCGETPSNMSWYKYEGGDVLINSSKQSRIKTEWKQLSNIAGIYYLIFTNIVRNDSGQFTCQIGSERSHLITVSVDDIDEFRTNSTRSPDPEATEWWLYVYSAAAIGALVLIVIIISVAALRGCKGKPRKEEQRENQYMVIPMTQQPLPQASPGGSPSAPPRRSPSGPPCRSSTRRKTQPRQGSNQERGEREEREAGSSIFYATLNHPLPPRGRVRPPRPTEEPSEYAAIRVA